VKIIVADDHRDVRDVVCRTLARCPYLEVVAAAESGEEAISLAILHEPNVVLMDAGMPGMGGIEATRRVKQALPGTRVVGHSSRDAASDMKAAGASDFVEKGVPTQRLFEAILQAAQAPSACQEMT
jgi:DNA-binding NarL/FixJ family response regulator